MKPTLTLTTICALFAIADGARAGTKPASPQPVLEIVTFRVTSGVDTDRFLKAAAGTEIVLRARGALIRRFLTVDDDGLWTDVIEWTDRDSALSAAEAVMATPEFQDFGGMIDPASVSMRHASILWRME